MKLSSRMDRHDLCTLQYEKLPVLLKHDIEECAFRAKLRPDMGGFNMLPFRINSQSW